MIYLTNAFSINMLVGSQHVVFTPIHESAAKVTCQVALSHRNLVNAVGHPSTDLLLRTSWPFLPEGQRINVTLEAHDQLIVAQYQGPRLREGETILPDGAMISWWRVDID